MNKSTILNLNDIKKLLNIKPPYLLLDRVDIPKDKTKCTGTKNVSANEPFFAGHFPDNPVMPGVLQVEAIFQLAIVAIKSAETETKPFPLLTNVKKTKFRKPVIPGNQLVISIKIAIQDNGEYFVKGSIESDNEITAETQLVIRFVDSSLSELVPESVSEVQEVSQEETTNNQLDIIDIQKIIPHRYPFLLIDRILEHSTDEGGTCRLTGLKNVTANEPHTVTCYEDIAFVSNVLQIEMLAQVGCVGMLLRPQNKDKLIFFMSIDYANFFRPVIPGDQLTIREESVAIREKFGKANGKIFAGKELVAEAQFKFAIR